MFEVVLIVLVLCVASRAQISVLYSDETIGAPDLAIVDGTPMFGFSVDRPYAYDAENSDSTLAIVSLHCSDVLCTKGSGLAWPRAQVGINERPGPSKVDIKLSSYTNNSVPIFSWHWKKSKTTSSIASYRCLDVDCSSYVPSDFFAFESGNVPDFATVVADSLPIWAFWGPSEETLENQVYIIHCQNAEMDVASHIFCAEVTVAQLPLTTVTATGEEFAPMGMREVDGDLVVAVFSDPVGEEVGLVEGDEANLVVVVAVVSGITTPPPSSSSSASQVEVERAVVGTAVRGSRIAVIGSGNETMVLWSGSEDGTDMSVVYCAEGAACGPEVAVSSVIGHKVLSFDAAMSQEYKGKDDSAVFAHVCYIETSDMATRLRYLAISVAVVEEDAINDEEAAGVGIALGTSVLVDTTEEGDSVSACAIADGEDGFPVIAYVVNNATLRVLHCQDVACSTHDSDKALTVDEESFLVIDELLPPKNNRVSLPDTFPILSVIIGGMLVCFLVCYFVAHKANK